MIADNIRVLCRERGITLAELERSTGLGNGLIAKWNENNPRLDRIKAVADFFGVTVDSLITGGADHAKANTHADP